MFEPVESGIRVSVVAHAMLGYHIRISRVWIKLVAVDGSIYHGLRLIKDVQMFVYANGLHDELGRDACAHMLHASTSSESVVDALSSRTDLRRARIRGIGLVERRHLAAAGPCLHCSAYNTVRSDCQI